jgi:hypothetical protein
MLNLAETAFTFQLSENDNILASKSFSKSPKVRNLK